jgi:transposase
MNKPRRYLSATEKAAIVRRHLVEKVPVSTLADALKIQPSQIHGWIKLVLDQAEAAFERSARSGQRAQDRRVAQLEEQLAKSHQKLAKKNEVVAELMEEHVQLKKELGEL